MKLKRFTLVPAGASLLLLLASPGFAQGAYPSGTAQQPSATTQSQSMASEHMSTHHKAKTVDISQVPQAARDTAQKQLGAAPEKAKELANTHPQEYELSAKNSSGKNERVWVFADGTLAKKGSSHNTGDAG